MNTAQNIKNLNAKQTAAYNGLSKRARKTLALIEEGRFYDWGPSDCNQASIEELIAAGLIVPGGRVVVIKRCWVTVGSKPFVMDKMATLIPMEDKA